MYMGVIPGEKQGERFFIGAPHVYGGDPIGVRPFV